MPAKHYPRAQTDSALAENLRRTEPTANPLSEAMPDDRRPVNQTGRLGPSDVDNLLEVSLARSQR